MIRHTFKDTFSTFKLIPFQEMQPDIFYLIMNDSNEVSHVRYMCPACKFVVHLPVGDSAPNSVGAKWKLSMDNGKPTLSPSVGRAEHCDHVQNGKRCCHYWVRDGECIDAG